MPDLIRAVTRLVEVATDSDDDRALRSAVAKVLSSFDADDEGAADAAFQIFDAGIAKAEGRPVQVLLLALGALVEAGASPELAWPVASNGLLDALEGAARFAATCVKLAKTEEVDVAIEAAGARAASRHPDDAEAWRTLPARCLASVACLTRSRAVRRDVDEDIADAAYPLEDAVLEAGLLRQILRLLDDETLVVVHPASGRGFEVSVCDVASNHELAILLADALVGSERDGGLPGRAPKAADVALLKGGGKASKTPKVVRVPFVLRPWTALRADGSWAEMHEHGHDELDELDEHDEHEIALDDAPADIAELSGQRIVLLDDRTDGVDLEVEAPYDGLAPNVTVTQKLTPADVARILRSITSKAPSDTAVEKPAPKRPTRKAVAEPARKAGAAGSKATKTKTSASVGRKAAAKRPASGGKTKKPASSTTKKRATGDAKARPKRR